MILRGTLCYALRIAPGFGGPNGMPGGSNCDRPRFVRKTDALPLAPLLQPLISTTFKYLYTISKCNLRFKKKVLLFLKYFVAINTMKLLPFLLSVCHCPLLENCVTQALLTIIS